MLNTEATYHANNKRRESFSSPKPEAQKGIPRHDVAVHGVFQSPELRRALFGIDPVYGILEIKGAELRAFKPSDLPVDNPYSNDPRFKGVEGVRLLRPNDPNFETSLVRLPLLSLTPEQLTALEVFDGLQTEDAKDNEKSIFKRHTVSATDATKKTFEDQWVSEYKIQVYVLDEKKLHDNIGERVETQAIKHETPRSPQDLVGYAGELYEKFVKPTLPEELAKTPGTKEFAAAIAKTGDVELTRYALRLIPGLSLNEGSLIDAEALRVHGEADIEKARVLRAMAEAATDNLKNVLRSKASELEDFGKKTLLSAKQRTENTHRSAPENT